MYVNEICAHTFIHPSCNTCPNSWNMPLGACRLRIRNLTASQRTWTLTGTRSRASENTLTTYAVSLKKGGKKNWLCHWMKEIYSLLPFCSRWAALTRCYLDSCKTMQKSHRISGKQARYCSLDKNISYISHQPLTPKWVFFHKSCRILWKLLCSVKVDFLDMNKCSLPYLMCWRASSRFSKPRVSHWLVLSKYMVATSGRVIRTMFATAGPEGWKMSVPIDSPVTAFSTEALFCCAV